MSTPPIDAPSRPPSPSERGPTSPVQPPPAGTENPSAIIITSDDAPDEETPQVDAAEKETSQNDPSDAEPGEPQQTECGLGAAALGNLLGDQVILELSETCMALTLERNALLKAMVDGMPNDSGDPSLDAPLLTPITDKGLYRTPHQNAFMSMKLNIVKRFSAADKKKVPTAPKVAAKAKAPKAPAKGKTKSTTAGDKEKADAEKAEKDKEKKVEKEKKDKEKKEKAEKAKEEKAAAKEKEKKEKAAAKEKEKAEKAAAKEREKAEKAAKKKNQAPAKRKAADGPTATTAESSAQKKSKHATTVEDAEDE